MDTGFIELVFSLAAIGLFSRRSAAALFDLRPGNRYRPRGPHRCPRNRHRRIASWARVIPVLAIFALNSCIVYISTSPTAVSGATIVFVATDVARFVRCVAAVTILDVAGAWRAVGLTGGDGSFRCGVGAGVLTMRRDVVPPAGYVLTSLTAGRATSRCQAAACRWTSRSPRAEPPLERGGHAKSSLRQHVNRSPPERMMTMKQLDSCRTRPALPACLTPRGVLGGAGEACNVSAESRPTREQAGGTAMFPLKASGVRSRRGTSSVEAAAGPSSATGRSAAVRRALVLYRPSMTSTRRQTSFEGDRKGRPSGRGVPDAQQRRAAGISMPIDSRDSTVKRKSSPLGLPIEGLLLQRRRRAAPAATSPAPRSGAGR